MAELEQVTGFKAQQESLWCFDFTAELLGMGTGDLAVCFPEFCQALGLSIVFAKSSR
jgi:hypothetical protein